MNINERVDQISAAIDELRDVSPGNRSPADGRRARQLIDALFRTVHTFKAAAAAEGSTDLSRTAHDFEDLLQSLRTGQLTLNDEVLRVFDETVAALRDGSQTIAVNRLNQLTTSTSTTGGELPAQFANLKDEERHRAAAALAEGANLYVMEVVFDANDFHERFRQLKAQLEKGSELISTSPTMQGDKIIFQVVYASRSEKIPIQTVVRQAVVAGQAVATALTKQVEFVVKGEELLLERSVSDALTDALVHLVRNAVDHAIEACGAVVIEVSAGEISVTDNGRGIAPENLPRLFQPGFSTTKDVTEFSGRGVGLDAVKTAVEEFGGSVSVTSEPGKGSRFKITIPNPSSDA